MTDALPSDAIQGKPGPTPDDRALPTTKDFGSTAKDVPASDSHHLSNGHATTPTDVEKPPQALSGIEVQAEAEARECDMVDSGADANAEDVLGPGPGEDA